MHITARSPRFLTAFRFLRANLRSFAGNKITWPWFYMRCSKWLYVVRPSNRNVHMYNLKEKQKKMWKKFVIQTPYQLKIKRWHMSINEFALQHNLYRLLMWNFWTIICVQLFHTNCGKLEIRINNYNLLKVTSNTATRNVKHYLW